MYFHRLAVVCFVNFYENKKKLFRPTARGAIEILPRKICTSKQATLGTCSSFSLWRKFASFCPCASSKHNLFTGLANSVF